MLDSSLPENTKNSRVLNHVMMMQKLFLGIDHLFEDYLSSYITAAIALVMDGRADRTHK